MKLRSSAVVCLLFALVALVLSARFLTAEALKSPGPRSEGFTQPFVFIESKDGRFTVLRAPQVRTLAGKLYLVGSTLHVPGLTKDELFDQLVQWVCMEDIRRMAETDALESFYKLRELVESHRKSPN